MYATKHHVSIMVLMVIIKSYTTITTVAIQEIRLINNYKNNQKQNVFPDNALL